MISLRTHQNEDHVCGKRSKIRKTNVVQVYHHQSIIWWPLARDILVQSSDSQLRLLSVCWGRWWGVSRDTSHPPCELRSTHLECTQSLPVCMLLVGALGQLGKNQFSVGHGVQGRRVANGTQILLIFII